jgi:hypothetical protein
LNPPSPQTQQDYPLHDYPLHDYYVEHGCVVFTAAYLLRRGTCCSNGCRHCPYRKNEPSALAAGSPTINADPCFETL